MHQSTVVILFDIQRAHLSSMGVPSPVTFECNSSSIFWQDKVPQAPGLNLESAVSTRNPAAFLCV